MQTTSKLFAVLATVGCIALAGCNKPSDPAATPGTSTSPSTTTTPSPMPTEPTSAGTPMPGASAASGAASTP